MIRQSLKAHVWVDANVRVVDVVVAQEVRAIAATANKIRFIVLNVNLM